MLQKKRGKLKEKRRRRLLIGLDMYLIKRKKDILKRDYWDFDTEEMYWRKANQIHRYFCENGEEIKKDVIYKISKENLQKLYDKCCEVLKVVKTKKGKIKNGQELINGEWKDIFEDGIEIINQEEVANILPTQDGFFFGSTEYDEWYLDDIKRTKEKLENILDNINNGNYDKYDFYYLASW